MNSHTAMIFLILTMIVAGGAIYSMNKVTSDVKDNANREIEAGADIKLLGVTGENISDKKFSTVRISVTSDNAISINDSTIYLKTQEDAAVLKYRDGNLERNKSAGFYTE